MTEIDTSDVTTLRRLNARTTLDQLRAQPEQWFTVRELSDLTELSRPTVSRVLEDLSNTGAVESLAGQPGATGRPARRYRFDSRSGMVLSFDTGRAFFNLVITDLAGTPIASRLRPVEAVTTEAEFLRHVREVADEALAAMENPPPVKAVSIALPGALDENDRIRVSVFTPEWVGFDLRKGLEELFPEIPVLMARDVELATLSEQTSGALRGVESAVHLLFSHQSSSTIVIDGQLMQGAHGLAGARPQPHFDESGKKVADWATLTSELYQGHARQRLSQIIAAAQQGSATDTQLLRDYAEGLAARVTFLARALAPQVLVVGGQMMAMPELALPPLQAAVREAVGEHTEVRIGEHPFEKAAPLGGAYAALSAIDWIS